MEHEWITKKRFTQIYMVCSPKTAYSALGKGEETTGDSGRLKGLGLLDTGPRREAKLLEETSTAIRCLMGIREYNLLCKVHKLVRSTTQHTGHTMCLTMFHRLRGLRIE